MTYSEKKRREKKSPRVTGPTGSMADLEKKIGHGEKNIQGPPSPPKKKKDKEKKIYRDLPSPQKKWKQRKEK